MFSRHCVRVQTRNGRNSLTFTTSLTGWAFWTLKCGERTGKSTRSDWARESLFYFRGRELLIVQWLALKECLACLCWEWAPISYLKEQVVSWAAP